MAVKSPGLHFLISLDHVIHRIISRELLRVVMSYNLPCFELSFFAQSGEFLSFSKAESICWNFISILINNAIVKQIEETSKIQKLRTNLCPSPSANSSDVVDVDSFLPSVAIFRSARSKRAFISWKFIPGTDTCSTIKTINYALTRMFLD